MTDSDSTGSVGEGRHPELCDLCGAVVPAGNVNYAVVPDSSAVYWLEPAMDGRRMIRACSVEHLARLIREYKRRPFVEAELWAGKMARAMFWHSGKVSEDEVAAETGLSPEQIEQAAAWHNQEVERRRHLRRRDGQEGPR